ncbi:unnamed protein product [Mytilus coruscus]|uniref:Uncharacterized protein n=1 Tax=Mytilus coruscus TaxID=42192 RepID=A0A6J8B0C9_MYTCO|nr:unnamed protein product [Mytilus coruscus]
MIPKYDLGNQKIVLTEHSGGESAGFSPVKRLKIESIDEPIASISFPLCSSTPLKPLIPLEPVSTDDEIQIVHAHFPEILQPLVSQQPDVTADDKQTKRKKVPKTPMKTAIQISSESSEDSLPDLMSSDGILRLLENFIIQYQYIQHRQLVDQKSIYADDNGVWNTASPRSYYRVDIRDGRIENVVPDNIKEETRETKPRQLFKKLVDDAGGPLYSSSASSEPRNLQQIYNIRSSTKAATKTDQLTHLVAQIRESTFVHELAADGESLQYVLASEKQLMDLDTFCTHQLHFLFFG